MPNSLEEAIAALESAGVRYVVVGGVAVVLHGHLRVTGDLDIVVDLEEENARTAIKALVTLGYQPRAPVPAEAFADETQREGWVRDKNMQVFSLWRSHGDLEIDLFVDVPFDFAEVHARALRLDLEESQATVISLDDLLNLKRAAGRPQDLADVAALEALQGEPCDE